jgi:ATP-dependent protease HslVU (ClpYQ) peptidase subunit
MNNSLYQNYYDYLAEEVMTPFYNDRLNNLNKLRLKDVLKRKNPYLFKAKNLELAGDLVKSIVDAFLSSQEETKFGNLLERFAIYVSQSLYGGFKSNFKSVDLEFERDGIYYIVGIKSGTNWANSDQIAAMKSNFKIAKQNLRQKGVTSEIIAVNGCMYGRETMHLKNNIDIEKVYYKYAGQDFWYFISNDDNLYQEIIVPIDEKAKEKDEKFKSAYAAKVNEMTQDFILNFMKNNQIDWVKLIDYVSKRGKSELDTAYFR